MNQARAQVSRDLYRTDGAWYPHGTLQQSSAREISDRFLEVSGGIAELSLRHHRSHADAKLS
jgi:hypothetical protein